MAESPWGEGGRGATATIKYGPDFEAPWFVANGSPESIKTQLIEFFGLEGVESQTPHEVFLSAVKHAQAAWAVQASLDGSPAKYDRQNGAQGRSGGTQRKSGGWPGQGAKKDEDSKPEHPFANVLSAIADVTNADELKRVYAQYPDAFQNEDVKQASKDKAKSLA